MTKDSEVRIQESPEGTLLVLPPDFESGEANRLEFELKGSKEMDIERLLVGSYIVGAKNVELKFADGLNLTTRGTISKWIRRLGGFEILDEHSKSITLSDISEKQVVIPILKRQFSTTKYMLSELLNMMKSKDFTQTSRIIDRDDDVDRHRYFVERLCHLALHEPAYARKIDITPSDSLHFSLAAKYIERLADHICGAAEKLAIIGNIDSSIFKQTAALSELYNESMSVFFRVEGSRRKSKTATLAEDTREAFDTLNNAEAIAAEFSKSGTSRKGVDSHLVLLYLHLERIAYYCADISEVAINRIIQSHLASRKE
jgi:phosphate uptake regulator